MTAAPARVVVVADDPSVRTSLARLLKTVGYDASVTSCP
jgi:hypothetical protein